MSTRSLVLIVALGFLGDVSRAEEPKPTRPQSGSVPQGFHIKRIQPSGTDPVGSKLFPPELIMGHQEELGIEDAQRTAILQEIEKTQGHVLQLQWQMQAAMEQLAKSLDVPKIDEAKALSQADRLMGIERDVKRTHLGILIRIRNLLTDSQRARLTELRAKNPL
jgi:Spy/CpxP family protein refolding chaperone